MANVEFWLARPTHYWGQPSVPMDGTFSFARRYEDAGFDGMLFFDTQNLAPEALVSLAAAAKETTSLKLGTCFDGDGHVPWLFRPVPRFGGKAGDRLIL